MKGQKGFVRVAPASFHLPGQAWGHKAAARVARWWALARERRQLAALSDAALHDLGLSRADITEEAERPFWDDPLSK